MNMKQQYLISEEEVRVRIWMEQQTPNSLAELFETGRRNDVRAAVDALKRPYVLPFRIVSA